MLWYLHFCAEEGIIVTSYDDQPTAIMETESGGSGRFIEASLNPIIEITDQHQEKAAIDLHSKVHRFCFIASSVNFSVKINPLIKF